MQNIGCLVRQLTSIVDIKLIKFSKGPVRIWFNDLENKKNKNPSTGTFFFGKLSTESFLLKPATWIIGIFIKETSWVWVYGVFLINVLNDTWKQWCTSACL